MTTALGKKFAQGCLDNWKRLGCNNHKKFCTLDYGDGTGCAIGVNLTTEQCAKAQEYGANGHRSLAAYNIIQELTFSDVNDLDNLMLAHDRTCLALASGHRAADKFRKRFRRLCERMASSVIPPEDTTSLPNDSQTAAA